MLVSPNFHLDFGKDSVILSKIKDDSINQLGALDIIEITYLELKALGTALQTLDFDRIKHTNGELK